jgi:aspartate kinase
VDGVYSADPRSVPAARHLPELDYDTMQEMAEAGAKVLNAQAIEWAKRNSVTVFARRTGSDYTAPGAALETRVSQNSSDARARAVVAQQNLALLQSPAPGALAETLAELELPIRDFAIRDGCAIATVPLLNVPDWQRLKAELTARIPSVRAADADMGSVSLIGVGVGTSARLVNRAWTAARSHALWFSTSPLRISCIADAERVSELERAWHSHFVTSGSGA